VWIKDSNNNNTSTSNNEQKKGGFFKNSNNKPKANRRKKIRLFPNKEQKQKLDQCFGTVRWIYNELLDKFRSKLHNKQIHRFEKMKLMRDWCTTKKSKLITQDPNKYVWILDTPQPIRDAAVLDLLQAFESNQAKQKKQEERGEKVMKFTVKYKIKKRDSQTIYINKQQFINGVFYSKFFGQTKFKCREKNKEKKSTLPNELDYSAKLTRNNLGHYYLYISGSF
jgi:hypothetical protein